MKLVNMNEKGQFVSGGGLCLRSTVTQCKGNEEELEKLFNEVDTTDDIELLLEEFVAPLAPTVTAASSEAAVTVNPAE